MLQQLQVPLAAIQNEPRRQAAARCAHSAARFADLAFIDPLLTAAVRTRGSTSQVVLLSRSLLTLPFRRTRNRLQSRDGRRPEMFSVPVRCLMKRLPPSTDTRPRLSQPTLAICSIGPIYTKLPRPDGVSSEIDGTSRGEPIIGALKLD